MNPPEFGEVNHATSPLARVLQLSPNLRKLCVSLQKDGGKYDAWFGELCSAYAGTGAAPLKLRSLGFGNTFFPLAESGDMEAIRKLTDLSVLEEISFRWN